MDGTAKSASWFLQANKSNGNTASIYQDIPIITSPGESYTFSVWLRRNGSGSRSARVVLWGLGGANESALTWASNIPGAWTQYVVTLNVVQAGHTTLRAEIYLDTGCCGLNHDIDASRVVKN